MKTGRQRRGGRNENREVHCIAGFFLQLNANSRKIVPEKICKYNYTSAISVSSGY